MAKAKEETTNCGVSHEGHIAQLLVGLRDNGLGARCTGTYEALVEVVDYIQRTFNHTYTAKGILTDENLKDVFTKGVKDAQKAQDDVMTSILQSAPNQGIRH